MANSISWVFLDVGNVLVCDDPSMAMLYRMIHDAIMEAEPGITFDDILAERERLILDEQQGRPWRELACRYIGNEGWRQINRKFLATLELEYEDYNIPVPGVESILAELGRRHRLAVAANQAGACRLAFERLGWMQYFSEFWISEEARKSKPSPEFFSGLLEKIQCPPAQAVMVGDRIDADIISAKSLGMRTIQIQSDFADLDRPVNDERDPLYYDSLNRTRVGYAPITRLDQTPDAVVHSLGDLPGALKDISSTFK